MQLQLQEVYLNGKRRDKRCQLWGADCVFRDNERFRGTYPKIIRMGPSPFRTSSVHPCVTHPWDLSQLLDSWWEQDTLGQSLGHLSF